MHESIPFFYFRAKIGETPDLGTIHAKQHHESEVSNGDNIK